MKLDLRHAYAILGVPFGAPMEEVTKQYKQLVRRWHPDRFAGDPTNTAEASEHTRLLNEAYGVIRAAERPRSRPAEPPPPEEHQAASHDAPHVTLTPEQIDAIVDAINADSTPSMRDSISDALRDLLRPRVSTHSPK